MCFVRSQIFLLFVLLVVRLFHIRWGRLSCWVRGFTVSSHETLLSCHRPVILGRHSVELPSENTRLSGTCWILIRMMVCTRLFASLCFFRSASVLAPKLSRLFCRLLCCGEFPLERQIADVTPFPKGPLSALLCNYRPISITPVLSKVFERLISLLVLVAFWRDMGSCHLTSRGRIWVPVMLFWTSSLLVR